MLHRTGRQGRPRGCHCDRWTRCEEYVRGGDGVAESVPFSILLSRAGVVRLSWVERLTDWAVSPVAGLKEVPAIRTRRAANSTLIGWDFDAHRAQPSASGRADEARRLHPLAGQPASRARGLSAALGHGRDQDPVSRHDGHHACPLDGAQAHPHQARRRPSARRLASSEDRRDRRSLRLLRRHRHDQQPLGHARASRRRSAPRAGPAAGPMLPGTTPPSRSKGRSAAALGELARERWQLRRRRGAGAGRGGGDRWPEGLDVPLHATSTSASRAPARNAERAEVREIEQLYLDQIARAPALHLCREPVFRLAPHRRGDGRRLAEPDGPEIVLVNPSKPHGWLEPMAMDTARARLFEALRRHDRHDRLRLYHPVHRRRQADLRPRQDHDRRRRRSCGSARPTSTTARCGLDTECDVTIDAGRRRQRARNGRDRRDSRRPDCRASRRRRRPRSPRAIADDRLADRRRSRRCAAPDARCGPTRFPTSTRSRNGWPTMRSSIPKAPTRCSSRWRRAACSGGCEGHAPEPPGCRDVEALVQAASARCSRHDAVRRS